MWWWAGQKWTPRSLHRWRIAGASSCNLGHRPEVLHSTGSSSFCLSNGMLQILRTFYKNHFSLRKGKEWNGISDAGSPVRAHLDDCSHASSSSECFRPHRWVRQTIPLNRNFSSRADCWNCGHTLGASTIVLLLMFISSFPQPPPPTSKQHQIFKTTTPSIFNGHWK